MTDPTQVDDAQGRRLEALLARRRPWLIAQARNLCRNGSDAEDLVQETFVRFIASFGQASSLPAEHVCASWLVTTLTNHFYNQVRRQRAHERGASDPALLDPLQVAPEPAVHPIYDQLPTEQFSEAIKALSPRVRATFELHASGRKYKEIAELQGIPAGTVAKRLHDARSRLRKLLEPYVRGGEN